MRRVFCLRTRASVRKLTVVSCVASTPCVLGAQTPEQRTFRSGVDVVAVDVPVIDRAGRPVADPRPDDPVVTVTGGERVMVSGRPEALLERVTPEIPGLYLLGSRSKPPTATADDA